jgi:Transposase
MKMESVQRRQVSRRYKHSCEGDCLEVVDPCGTRIPRTRLTRAASRYHRWSHPETGRTHGSVCNRPAAQQPPPRGGKIVQTVIERGCGLDVHQATVVACLLSVLRSGRVRKQMRTFGTTTQELLNLRQWLLSAGCTHLAMESTGVYWKPVYAILEGALEIVVANAQHVKKVPGRKTDVKDAEWLAGLLCHGLLRSSFVPPKPIRELRDLTRYRRKLVESQSAERNRLLKTARDGQHQVGQRGLRQGFVRARMSRPASARAAAFPKAMCT